MPVARRSRTSPEEFFKLADADSSHLIDVYEFGQAMKYYRLELSQQTVVELFARFDQEASGLLDAPEFEDAFEALVDDIVEETLCLLGISAVSLLLSFLLSLAVLLGGLAFVFLGTLGFGGSDVGETFNTVINSLLALAAGVVGFRAGFHAERVQEAIHSRKSTVFREVFERYTL